MKRIMGFVLLGLVFGGIFATSVIEKGLVSALIIWGAALATTAVVCAGVWLIVDG